MTAFETSHPDRDHVVPGTIHLIQNHGTASRHDIVLVPTPSADPTDPLVSPKSQCTEKAAMLIKRRDGASGGRATTSLCCCKSIKAAYITVHATNTLAACTALSWVLSPIGRPRYTCSLFLNTAPPLISLTWVLQSVEYFHVAKNTMYFSEDID